MKTIRIITSILLITMFAQSQAFGWSGPGHAAVAAMAYRDLASDPTLRKKLVDVLKKHPSFKGWRKEFNSKKSGFPAELDLGMFLFIRAATWPDAIRRTGIPALKPFDHPNWHFVDYALKPPSFPESSSPTPQDDVLFGINESLNTLADNNADPVLRAAMLSWLIHLVGDIHQPLHCATLVTTQFPAPTGDRGGNSFIIFQSSTNHAKTKLHSFWDGRLGSELVPDPVQALQNAKMLKSLHSRSSLSEMSAADNTEQWSFESRTEATQDVYKFKNKMLKQNAVLPSGYVTNSHTVARRRLALAGYRLSDEMKKTVF